MIEDHDIDPEQPLETDRLILEPLLPSHAEELFPALQDERLYSYIPEDPPSDVERLEARYRAWSRRGSADGSELWLNYVALSRRSGRPVGTVQATVTDSGKALVAYQTFSGHVGNGYAREACRALTERLAHRGLTVEALVDTRNLSSQRLLEAVGFERVETIEGADHFKGQASDEYRYVFRPASVERSGPGRKNPRRFSPPGASLP